jgi:chromosomal replication initiator protein DnaA
MRRFAVLGMSEKQIWLSVLERLKGEIRDETVINYLVLSQLVATNSPQHYLLRVPNGQAERQLRQYCHVPIARAIQEATGTPGRLVLDYVITEHAKGGRHAPQSAVSLFPEAEDGGPSPSLADVLPTRATRQAMKLDRRRQRPGGPSSRPSRSGSVADAVLDRHSRPNGGVDTAGVSFNQTPAVIVHEPPPWLNSRYTFENFIVGSGNQFAYAACLAVADSPGEGYNPLFLYGGVGLGKTHLMHGIAHAIAPRGCKTLYVTSETFTNEIINAIRYRTTEEFRAKYRSVDVLLVDDIQFIAGKDSTEEEFFHTFNALHEAQKQIVVCSDRPPKAIDLAERLRSRFEWGLIVDIQPPDLETRLAILRTKAEALNFTIADDVLNYLAERIQTNVRELEGMLNRVVAFANLQKTTLTVDVARQALSSLTPEETPQRRITVDEILTAVSQYYHVSMDDLKGKKRDKRIVYPRHIAMFLMRQYAEVSLVEVGDILGGRDHSTVMHGCDNIEAELRREGSPVMQELAAIRQVMLGH